MSRSLIRRLRSSQYVKNVGWLVRGNLTAHLIQIAALPVLTRIYAPSDFGVYAVFTAFVAISSVTLTVRLESAILIAEDRDWRDLVILASRFVLGMSLVLSCILIMLRKKAILGHDVLPVWAVPLLFVTLSGLGFFSIGRANQLRHGRAKLLARARIDRAIGSVGVKLVSPLAAVGPVGLILGDTIGAWLAMKRVGSRLLFNAIVFKECLGSDARRVWARFRKFPYIELPSSLMDQAALALPVPMLAAIGGAEVAGLYGVARMVVVLPNAQIGRAVADGFQLKVSALIREGQYQSLMPTYWRTLGGLAAMGFIPYLALALISPWAFPIALGEKWQTAGDYAALLTIWMFFAFLVSPLSRIVSVLQRQELKLVFDLAMIVALFLLYHFTKDGRATPYEFVVALVSINVVRYILYGAMLGLTVMRAAKTHPR